MPFRPLPEVHAVHLASLPLLDSTTPQRPVTRTSHFIASLLRGVGREEINDLMAATKAEMVEWFASLKDKDLVAIDDGGLALVLVGQQGEVYFEIGGVPGDEEG